MLMAGGVTWMALNCSPVGQIGLVIGSVCQQVLAYNLRLLNVIHLNVPILAVIVVYRAELAMMMMLLMEIMDVVLLLWLPRGRVT